jgi:hypothetical protein
MLRDGAVACSWAPPVVAATERAQHADEEPARASEIAGVDRPKRSPYQDAVSSVTWFGEPVVRRTGSRKNEGRGFVGFPSDSAAFRWSGRQDLNLRPLGPERRLKLLHLVCRAA